MMQLTKDAQTVVEVVTTLGGHALLVGGCVRDQVLGIESKDIDIEVHGFVAPEVLIRRLRPFGRVDTVGQSFGVIKFGDGVDVSFPRRDSKSGAGHTGFTIEFDNTMTVEEALSRRDFTINSMAMDPLTGRIIDPFGGLLDLERGIIRHTSDEAFADDPLRVMRAVQFASRFEFKIASATAKLARSIVDRFDELSVERVWVEWEKILTKGQSMQAATEALIQTGWIAHFPEWGVRAGVTDRVLRSFVVRPQGERRMSLILGTQFADVPQADLDRFLSRIDAPLWLRRDARKLAHVPFLNALPAEVEARFVARSVAPLRFSDWVACHRLWDHPIADGGEFLPALLTGDDLISLGMKPGPDFGGILSSALFAQDMEGWTTKKEALAWLGR